MKIYIVIGTYEHMDHSVTTRNIAAFNNKQAAHALCAVLNESASKQQAYWVFDMPLHVDAYVLY